MQRAAPRVMEVIEPVVAGLGYECVGAEFGMAENGQTLRVYIDKEGGVILDDCAVVSRQLDAVLDVEDVISSAYLLEVSSPGLDRPLFKAHQFAKQVGEVVRIRLLAGQGGRRNFKGELKAVNEELDQVDVEIDGEIHTIELPAIEHAYLVGRIENAKQKI